MGIDKNVLEQYSSMKKEIADLERMIADSNKKIKRYEKQVISDTVTGTRADMTIGVIKVEGIAQQWIDREHELNQRRVEKMERFKKKLEETVVKVEEFIQSIDDSEIRRIARMRYIEGLKWRTVATYMGKGYTEEACRMKMERYLKL